MSDPGRLQFIWPQPGGERHTEDLAGGHLVRWTLWRSVFIGTIVRTGLRANRLGPNHVAARNWRTPPRYICTGRGDATGGGCGGLGE